MAWPTVEQVKRRLGITSPAAGITEDVTLALNASIAQVEADVGRVPMALVPTGEESTTDLMQTVDNHGLEVNDLVQFSGLVGLTGLVNGTEYHVIAGGLDANHFKVSASQGGAAVNVTAELVAGYVRKVIDPTDSMSAAALLLAVSCYKAPEAPFGVAGIFDTGGIYVARSNPNYWRLLTGQRERFGIA